MPETLAVPPPPSVDSRWWRRPKTVAVFAASAADAADAVEYVRREIPALPIWLFTLEAPRASVVSQCEQVFHCRSGIDALQRSWRMTQTRWMALGVTAWTGRSAPWLLKLAPLLTPPFRTLVMNEHGGFFPPTPWMLLRHCRERTWQTLSASEPSLKAQMVFHRWKVKIWGAGLAVRDGVRFYWRWWPVMLREWWEPKRVKLTYGLFYRAVGALLSAWQRVKDIYWSIADPFEKRRFAPHRLFIGLAWLLSSVVLVLLLETLYPLLARRFAKLSHRPPTSPTVVSADVPAVDGGSSTEIFRYQTRRWSHKLLRRLIHTSSARYLLLLRDHTDPPDVSDLFPLFRDPQVFAVGYQSNVRTWDRSLFCRAPFRQLQAGEVSQVMAPLSPAILIDRAKLAMLGLPSASLPLAGLLQLFWHAEALGLCSYQVGSSLALKPLRRLPSEETEAAWRLLRAQPAAIPDTRLSWGNIAREPLSAQPFRPGRLRVLVVSPYLPYPLSHGGAVRIYNICKALSSQVDFVLATFREKSDTVTYSKLHEIFREVYIVDRDEPAGTDTSLPEQVRGQQSQAMEALIEHLCTTRGIDIVQIEYTHLAPLQRHTKSRPAILVEHDITFSLYQQLAERNQTAATRAEYDRWHQFERHWLETYQAVWTMSPADRELALNAGASPAHTWTVPNGVDLERFQPSPEPTGDPEIFFVGSFRHYPNLLGFEHLLAQVMPEVWQRFPKALLRVVAGPEPEHYWKEFKKETFSGDFGPRVVLHGFVEDLRPLYAAATVVVMPLLVSAGTNIKLMEAMACGKAIVSTPVGCAGLELKDGADLLVRDNGDSFADAVCQLLADTTVRQALAARARTTAEQRFGWNAIAVTALHSYRQVVSR